MNRVVIVDDATDFRTLLSLALKRDGRFEVVASVGDGQAGIDAVREHQPDVVIMDVSMPVMDGLTATRLLKQDLPDLPILVLTGYGDARVEEEAHRAGADDFVDKSRLPAVVVEALAQLVPSSGAASRDHER